MIRKGLLTEWWAQDVDTVGKAAVAAAKQCIEGKKEQGVWQIDQGEILSLSKTGWKAET